MHEGGDGGPHPAEQLVDCRHVAALNHAGQALQQVNHSAPHACLHEDYLQVGVLHNGLVAGL